jgi:hypothetical protein
MGEEQVVLEQVVPKVDVTETKPDVVDQQQTETEQKPEVKPEGEEHKPARFQKRIDRLTREKYELRGRVETLEKMVQPQQQPQDLTPKREQFADDAAYLSAMIQHEVKKAMPVQQQPQPPVVNVDEVRKTFDDYDEVMEDADNVSIPRAAADAVIASPLSGHLQYYLTKNPDKANALFSMSPIAAIREVGRIEAIIESDIEAKKKQQPKPITKAKPPIEPVERSGDSGKIDPSKLSDKEWMKMEQAKLIKRNTR